MPLVLCCGSDQDWGSVPTQGQDFPGRRWLSARCGHGGNEHSRAGQPGIGVFISKLTSSSAPQEGREPGPGPPPFPALRPRLDPLWRVPVGRLGGLCAPSDNHLPPSKLCGQVGTPQGPLSRGAGLQGGAPRGRSRNLLPARCPSGRRTAEVRLFPKAPCFRASHPWAPRPGGDPSSGYHGGGGQATSHGQPFRASSPVPPAPCSLKALRPLQGPLRRSSSFLRSLMEKGVDGIQGPQKVAIPRLPSRVPPPLPYVLWV